MRTIEQASHLAGIETLVVTTDDDGRGKHLVRALGTEIDEESARRIYFRKRIEFYCVAPSMVAWLWRNVRRFDCVHVHALFSFTSIVAAIIAFCRGVPYVIRPLGVLSSYGVSQRRSLLKRISLALIEGSLLRRAKAIHCTSNAEARDVLAIERAARVVVQPLAVPLPTLAASQPALAGRSPHETDAQRHRPTGGCTVLFLSRLDPKKNIESLLEAWCVVLRGHPHAILAIAGRGESVYEANLRALAAKLGVADSVEWCGHVAGDEKERLFRRADLFVLPSFSENFGVAVAEALSYGLPCVVSRGVALSDDVEAADAGQIANTDAPSLSAALSALMSDSFLRSRQAVAARALAESKFSVNAFAARLARLYGEVLSKVEASSIELPRKPGDPV
jgi:glycosyltransferase involved in cell wall biosynthesis